MFSEEYTDIRCDMILLIHTSPHPNIAVLDLYCGYDVRDTGMFLCIAGLVGGCHLLIYVMKLSYLKSHPTSLGNIEIILSIENKLLVL